MEDMRSIAMWTLAVLVSVASPSWCGVDAGNAAETPTVKSLLRTATVAETAEDWPKAYASVVTVLNDPQFSALSADTQHFALALAAHAALQFAKPDEAHRFAVRATEMPKGDIDDWRNRLTAAMKIDAVVDEAVCVTEIRRRSGVQGGLLSEGTIFRVYRSTAVPEASEARTDMLLALYQRRWQPTGGRSASWMWLELARLLLLRQETELAAQVAGLVDNPDDVIIMRSDFRFRAVLNSKYVESDAHRAALKRLDNLKGETQSHPRSLRSLADLLHSMNALRMDAEVLALTEDVGSQVSPSDGGSSSYDDSATEYPWILNARATALRHMARFDAALDQLRRANAWPNKKDNASHAINLAALLVEMGKPDEALDTLPDNTTVNAYGRMQIAAVRLEAMTQLWRDGEAGAALDYLREHGRDAPATLQHALLKAGDTEGAERWLLTRLNDTFLRSQALLELQQFTELRYPPAATEWHARSAALRSTASVRAAAAKIGDIGRYLWRYDTFE